MTSTPAMRPAWRLRISAWIDVPRWNDRIGRDIARAAEILRERDVHDAFQCFDRRRRPQATWLCSSSSITVGTGSGR
jgi:hypothetical protein